uniref:MBD domain-containing protein n=1 Tax=Macrostomum lignano TaxID=282301 RepID=A0A1I8FJ18_9PLAT
MAFSCENWTTPALWRMLATSLSTDCRAETPQPIRRARKEGRVPPVYPNGWYLVMEGDQLKPGEAKQKPWPYSARSRAKRTYSMPTARTLAQYGALRVVSLATASSARVSRLAIFAVQTVAVG